MCWCKPEIRTPNCGSMQCLSAAIKAERNRIADALERDSMHWGLDSPSLLIGWIERLRKGEV